MTYFSNILVAHLNKSVVYLEAQFTFLRNEETCSQTLPQRKKIQNELYAHVVFVKSERTAQVLRNCTFASAQIMSHNLLSVISSSEMDPLQRFAQQ